ncbi:MAG: isoaspartyl peptidase/L-asparaginase [candidate division Zixibacteria bacterium]|nr:isoaspartyl peptidase/L-asparaginase [candidate division Zixibacteria bacterium]
MPDFGIVIHGGAGTILREKLTAELEAEFRQGLVESLSAGYEILNAGGTSLDAVQKAVTIMEDNPLFNCGRGAVFTYEGKHSMDAALMDGRTLAVGAVAGVRQIKNPIVLARLVMEQLPHILLAGEGAEEFAQANGIALMPDDYFYTERRWKNLLETRASATTDHETSHGTVGAVALDRSGNLAAATSTGGMTNCRYRRIGDTPIVGAGTYANNKTCAVSTTGHGEFFMRGVISYDLSAMIEYRGMTLADAAAHAIHHRLADIGGSGGLIAIDGRGNFALPFNTPGMYRGFFMDGGKAETAIFRE